VGKSEQQLVHKRLHLLARRILREEFAIDPKKCHVRYERIMVAMGFAVFKAAEMSHLHHFITNRFLVEARRRKK
jgi:hypothetical protein